LCQPAKPFCLCLKGEQSVQCIYVYIYVMSRSQVEIYDSFGANHCLLLLFQSSLVHPSSVCKIFWILLPPSAMITLHKTTILRILHCTNNNACTHINNNKSLKRWKIDQKCLETFQVWCWRGWTRSVQQNT